VRVEDARFLSRAVQRPLVYSREGIYFIDNTRKADSALELFAPQTRTTKVVGHLGKDVTNHGGHNLEISPDGHTALYVRVETWNGELVLATRGSW
jgi:hypothetical protein